MNTKPLSLAITCYPTYGGSGVVATEIGIAMARRGHSVHFIAYDIPRRLHRFLDNVYFHEVRVPEYPLFTYPPYSVALASKMVEVANDHSVNLFHVHYAVPHATSAYLAQQVLGNKAPKVITTLHGTDITLVGNDESYLPLTRFSIEQSNGITTPSDYLRESTYSGLGVSREVPIKVIPNFIDTERFRPYQGQEPRRFPNLLGKCFSSGRIITHVSNFRPVKRVTDVVEIFARVCQQTEAHLVLIGDGPERPKVVERIREYGLDERVCLLGKQEAFSEVLQVSDVFLLPSEHEGFGLAALEALSCGVPVVASAAGGIPEVFQHGQTGFLAPVGDVDKMAEQATQLLLDKRLHQEMSSAAREHVLNNYAQEKIIDYYEKYYRKILSED